MSVPPRTQAPPPAQAQVSTRGSCSGHAAPRTDGVRATRQRCLQVPHCCIKSSLQRHNLFARGGALQARVQVTHRQPQVPTGLHRHGPRRIRARRNGAGWALRARAQRGSARTRPLCGSHHRRQRPWRAARAGRIKIRAAGPAGGLCHTPAREVARAHALIFLPATRPHDVPNKKSLLLPPPAAASPALALMLPNARLAPPIVASSGMLSDTPMRRLDEGFGSRNAGPSASWAANEREAASRCTALPAMLRPSCAQQ